MKNNYKNLFSNIIIFSIGSFGSKLVSFFLVPLYTTYLSTGEYGISDLIVNLSNLIIPIISLTIQDSVLRFGLSTNSNKKAICRNAFIVFMFGVCLCVTITPMFSDYDAIDEWRWYLTANVISMNLINILNSYSKVKEKNRLFAFSSILQAVIIALLNILFLIVNNLGVRGYLLANIISNIAVAILLLVFTGAIKDIFSEKTNYKLLKDMVLFSLPLIVNNLSWWILNSSDKVMIETLISDNALGIYSASSKIPNLLSIVTSIFSSAWTISSVKEYEENNDNKFYANVFRYFTTTLFLGGSMLITISKDFSRIYVGKDFFDCWKYVPFLVVGIVFYSISAFYGPIYGIVKKNWPTTISTIVASLVNISINLLFLKKHGVVVASISTLVGYFVICIYRMFNSRKYLSFKINYVSFFVCSLVLLVESIFVYLSYNPYIVGFISLILISVVYFSVIKDGFKSTKLIAKKIFNKSNSEEEI